MSMTARENLISLWRRKGFEEMPFYFELCPSQESKFQSVYQTKKHYAEFFNFPFRWIGWDGFLKQSFTDWKSFFPGETFNPGTWFAIWGVANEPAPGSMHMTRMHHPMKNFTSIEEFEKYPYPVFDPSQLDKITKEVDDLHAKGIAASACMACTIWEIGWYMRSMEELMIGMKTDDPTALYHFDRLTNLACQRAEYFAKAGVDHILFGDDIGMQHSIMLSLEDYKQWLKPRLTKIIRSAKKINPDIIISYHSCGFVTPFIPDLIEAGVEVLNPVQPECMNFDEIHKEYGDVLSFWGAIGTQTTMPFGKPEDVRKAVLHNLEIAGEKGGLLCSPTHLLEPEVPWENIEAYINAVKEFSGRK